MSEWQVRGLLCFAGCDDCVLCRFLSELNGRERRRPAVARLRQSHANNNVLVVSNSRQVRTSLQNMERQQDEMFEL